MNWTTIDVEALPVICAGVIVADHLTPPIAQIPSPGGLVQSDDLVLNIGGLAANVSVILAKLGVGCRICGKVGDDFFGRFATETLENAGVDVSALGVDPNRATSQTVILNVQGEDRRFIHSFGANAGLTVDDIDSSVFPGAKVLYLGGYLILPGLDPELVADRFSKLREMGFKTVLDVACPGPDDYLSQLKPVLPHTDVFLPNSDEASLILGGESDPIHQAQAFRDLGASRVIITRGERGVVSCSEDACYRIGAYPVKLLDSTGGGDSFDAGYIAGLVDGLDELECLKLASAIGASCVRRIGTTAGIFSRAEADQFIQEHSLLVEQL